MSAENLKDFERLLLFFFALSEPPKDKENQLKLFSRISGLSASECRYALDVCVIKGFVDDVPDEGKKAK